MTHTCRSQKMPFPSKEAANEFLRKERRDGHSYLTERRKLRAYECPFCGQWHLTSMNKKESRAKSKKYAKKTGRRDERRA